MEKEKILNRVQQALSFGQMPIDLVKALNLPMSIIHKCLGELMKEGKVYARRLKHDTMYYGYVS